MDRPDEIKNNKLQCRDKAQKPSYEKRKVCPDCGGSMVYIYGEMYECPDCGCRALSDFGKMEWDSIGRGLAAMGGALAEVAVAVNLMPKNMVLYCWSLPAIGSFCADL